MIHDTYKVNFELRHTPVTDWRDGDIFHLKAHPAWRIGDMSA
jgi:hypothetical protein